MGDGNRPPRLAEDFLREIRPGADAFVRRVVDAVALALDHIYEQAREVARVGRRADLVVDDGERVMRPGEAQHGLDEVLAVHAEDPGECTMK